MPKLSSNLLAIGVRQLVVQEAFEMTWWFFESYLSSLTPSTRVRSCPLAGALRRTFFAPASMWALAFSLSVKRPVHSTTTSTPIDVQDRAFGSLTARTLMSLLPTAIAAHFAVTTTP